MHYVSQAHGAGLTPHLVYSKKFSLVLAVVEQVPEVHVISKHTIYQLLSASPIVCAEHVGNGVRDVLNERVHMHAELRDPSRSAGSEYNCALVDREEMRIR